VCVCVYVFVRRGQAVANPGPQQFAV